MTRDSRQESRDPSKALRPEHLRIGDADHADMPFDYGEGCLKQAFEPLGMTSLGAIAATQLASQAEFTVTSAA